MKRNIWCDADIYGQSFVWIVSLLPFIFFFSDALRKNEFYMLILVHGLGLLIIGVWQMTSTIINLLLAENGYKRFFKRNMLAGIILGFIFFCWVFSGNLNISFSTAKYRHDYVLAFYFLVIDIAAIRYWQYIRKYYKILVKNG